MVNGSKIYRDVLWRPNDEVSRQIKPVFMRVCGTSYHATATKVQQILTE